jgi:hypothetical protein
MNCRIAIGHPIGLLAIAAFGGLVMLVILATTAWAGSVPLTADAGVSQMLSASQPAENIKDVGLGIGYRPTYVNETGLEQYSRLLFLLGGNYGSGTGNLRAVARFGSWWGVDWYAGPGLMAIEEGNVYALGPIGEFRVEFDTGFNSMYFSAISGYVWRQAYEDAKTGEMVYPNPVPLQVKLGFMSQ